MAMSFIEAGIKVLQQDPCFHNAKQVREMKDHI